MVIKRLIEGVCFARMSLLMWVCGLCPRKYYYIWIPRNVVAEVVLKYYRYVVE